MRHRGIFDAEVGFVLGKRGGFGRPVIAPFVFVATFVSNFRESTIVYVLQSREAISVGI